ncbi:hypothetical protein BFJ66_g13050 [Fusarium oxysporum f. sp. cepae]|nr:hypothetical protein BFJ67_g15499 [Fusarium oxysporum f. sp. cepae]RKK37281.1 hypothetical protein BFJ66_g13050 [Fusarium oxysporum f. sp. cepae]
MAQFQDQTSKKETFISNVILRELESFKFVVAGYFGATRRVIDCIPDSIYLSPYNQKALEKMSGWEFIIMWTDNGDRIIVGAWFKQDDERFQIGYTSDGYRTKWHNWV